jgi:hypothetical protein
MLSPALTEHLSSVIPRIATQLHRGYSRIETEDLAQEMWAGALTQAENLEGLLAEGQLDILFNAVRRAGWRACKDDERQQRAERAAAEGYAVDDEQFYTMGLLRLLLPAYLDGGVVAEPPKGRVRGRSGLLSESGDYLAMMTDISLAMGKIKRHERAVIETYYAAPQGDDSDSRFTRNQIASSMGLTLNALKIRVHKAVRSLQRELGGDNPWRRRDMEYQTAPVGGRTDRVGTNPVSGVAGQPSISRQRALRGLN